MKMNKKVAALGGLAALAAVGGTWAYFSQSAAITNPFNTGKYGGSVIEHFNPSDGDDWQPGATVDKEVIAQNTGDQPLLVRVKMAEKWTAEKREMPAFDSVNEGDPDTRNEAFTEVEQNNATDGQTTGDQTVVHKNFADNSMWEEGRDGYWYYRGQLAPGASTEALLESVTLDKDVDLGEYTTTYQYCTTPGKDSVPNADTEWTTASGEDDGTMLAAAEDAKEAGNSFHVKKEVALNTEAAGYADADYELTITIEMVQPTEDAVIAEWGEDSLQYLLAWSDAE
mgnify:CR=1 FL=1